MPSETRLIDLIWERGPTEMTDRMLMLVIDYYTNGRTGTAWPSVATIARRACCSKRTAQRRLPALEQEGWIIRLPGHGRGHTTVYRIDRERFSTGSVKGDTVTPFTQPKGDTTSPFSEPEKVTPATQKVTPGPEKVTQVSPEPLEPLEPSSSSSPTSPLTTAPDPTGYEADDDEMALALEGFPPIPWKGELRAALATAMMDRGHNPRSVNRYLVASYRSEWVNNPYGLILVNLRAIPPAEKPRPAATLEATCEVCSKPEHICRKIPEAKSGHTFEASSKKLVRSG